MAWAQINFQLFHAFSLGHVNIRAISFFLLSHVFSHIVQASSTQVKIGEDVEVTVSFTNPLPEPLTKGQFHLEATRMKPKSLVVDCK